MGEMRMPGHCPAPRLYDCSIRVRGIVMNAALVHFSECGCCSAPPPLAAKRRESASPLETTPLHYSITNARNFPEPGRFAQLYTPPIRWLSLHLSISCSQLHSSLAVDVGQVYSASPIFFVPREPS